VHACCSKCVNIELYTLSCIMKLINCIAVATILLPVSGFVIFIVSLFLYKYITLCWHRHRIAEMVRMSSKLRAYINTYLID
jgi:hypothetical protein